MYKKNLLTVVKDKAIVTGMTAAMAVNMLALNALAEEAGGGVDISSVTTQMTTSLTDLVSKAAVACAGVVGVGLTIFGLKWVVTKIMSFFRAIAK
ncbi:MAG: hypothetical protein J1F11_10225 [Oscillospiraceae bacterium]|nr:hypothetical protein [Oscillospiraceae bacterium]